MYTKAQRIDAMRSGATLTESISFDDVKINLYGDAAVVTSRVTIKGKMQGMPQTGTSMSTIVFARTKDGLRIVHGHPSPPGGPTPAEANTNTNSVAPANTRPAANTNTAANRY
jgi:ketosteroid isomerase-like protein